MTNQAIHQKIARLQAGGRPRLLDLFSGCGGLSLGFHTVGFEISAAVESDPDAARSHGLNFHNGAAKHSQARDIITTHPEDLAAELDIGPVDRAIDVIVGGPPCQAFARVGRSKLREIEAHPEAFRYDPRARLYQEYLRYVNAFQPLVVVMENVPDVLNHGGRNIAKEICEVLEEKGCVCGYTLLNAAYYGVPQTRERMFLVAYQRGVADQIRFPTPTHWVELPPGYDGTRAVAHMAVGVLTEMGHQPHIVSRGAQKCFLEYAEKVGKAWEVSEAPFNEHWFRGVVAKAIAFRWTDKMIGGSAWYQEDRGYKAQVVTYTLAWLVNHLHTQGLELDLSLIWQRQELPDEVGEVLRLLAPQVAATVKDAPPQMKNVGEFCKQQACWAAVARCDYRFHGALDGFVVDRTEAERTQKDAIAAKKMDTDIDFDRIVVAMLSDTGPYLSFARAKRLMSPKSDAALRRLTQGDVRLPPSERNALKYMLEKMQQAGFELPAKAKAALEVAP